MDPALLAFTTHGLDVEVHRHAAYQVVLSAGEPFRSAIGGTSHEGIYGFLIGPQVPHRCTVPAGAFTVVNVDPDSRTAAYLAGLLPGPATPWVARHPRDFATRFGLAPGGGGGGLPGLLLRRLAAAGAQPDLDVRVAEVIGVIRTAANERIDVAALARWVYLSPSRLAALFKAETGSPMSAFLMWTRLKRAVEALLAEPARPIADVAFATGFYDPPQLAKYMYKMIGVRPAAFRQNSDLVQVLGLGPR